MPQARRPAPRSSSSPTASDRETEAVARRHARGSSRSSHPRGLNAARNLGVDAAHGRSDRVPRRRCAGAARAGWTRCWPAPARDARLRCPRRPDPRRARGRRPACLRPRAAADHHARPRPRRLRRAIVWGANMALRRAAFDAVGPVRRGAWPAAATRRSGSIATRPRGGRVRYVAAAGLVHRRDRRRRPADAPVPRRLRARAHRPAQRRAQAAPRPRWPASCGCWPGASGTRCAAAAPMGS